MNLLQPLKLLLPALIPSWRFFDVIAPSPRIQFTLLDSEKNTLVDWQEFRPKAEHITILQTLKRMICNAKWNESLFLASCAERIMENYTPHSENEILNRIERDFHKKTKANYLQFRLVFIQRKGAASLEEKTRFTSRIQEFSKEKRNGA